jgi:DNA polymerase III delta prime subunit
MSVELFSWDHKYRPKTVAECILPSALKANLQSFIENGMTDFLFYGGPGTGKTTAALALAEECDMEYLFLNCASTDRGISSIRNLGSFAATLSDNGGRKLVILDEAAELTPEAQDALKNVQQMYASNCVFGMTANNTGSPHSASLCLLKRWQRSRETPTSDLRRS